jgi:hypothetical protein
MNEWQVWFITGIEHILDINGYDHMLFICLLTFVFPLKDWQKTLLLITAFTLGHSLTLALSVLNLVTVRQEYIEILIILTILATSAFQLFQRQNTAKRVMIMYGIICSFGLIHGMGFSFLLRSMIAKNDSIVTPLFWFNIGLEAGQIVIVFVITFLSLIVDKLFKNGLGYFRTSVTSIVIIVSLILLFTRTLNLINS